MRKARNAGRRRSCLLIFLAALAAAPPVWSKSLELSPPAQQGLQFLNNGHVLEAVDLLAKSSKDAPDDPSILLLLATTRYRIMSLSPYTKSDRAELIAIFDRLEHLCEPKAGTDDDALFFLSATQGLRAQLSGQEGDWWAAARLGKQMKRTSEELLERNPDYNEAYYLLGSYNYFADALPGYIKFFRMLIFFPGGNRKEGLEQLNRALEKGKIASIEAGRTLAYIYTYIEKRPETGVQFCDKVLSRCPDEFDIGLYKGINLYFGSDFKKAEETLVHVKEEIHAYSRMHRTKENEVVPAYATLEREVRYWTARALIGQKRFEDAEKILLDLKTPEIHQPYWIQRGVYLSLAEIDYIQNRNVQAESLVQKVLDWQDVRDAHDKARLLKREKGAAKPFDIDFR